MEQDELNYAGSDIEAPDNVEAMPHESHHEHDAQSKALIGRMKLNVKIIKWLVIAAGILAGILLVYGILLVTVFESSSGAFTGFIVLLVIEGLMFLAFAAMLVYTKLILNKLKKHK